ncbi:DsrE/DsrF/DrsH-like family protein (plasmid) [Halobaculum sp. CBA1158]|uniref:DsrE/DsrF/DrsH-like family protein n=1 Tax=Halobaculum sp. CBA1158 TaxID=2904243 RepID=UPI001F2770CA|nr:DsrE/DsrF/DrsH-like family protein [Halobaculum sp. CBA1158]UIP01654.1 DsrE/DsrF/DrsH-like family protein [Halobaculum sp. CBA1158]
MSTDTETEVTDEHPDGSATRIEELEARIETLEAEMDATAGTEMGDEKSMVIVATKGTLDMAYPPLILASTAAAFGWDVTVFHTFWGLDILHEEQSADLKLSAVGNPNMSVPNAVAALPGMDRLATTMMERRIADNDVATIDELLETSLEMGVDLQACQMTMDLMDYDDNAFHEGVTVGVGAATALSEMADADVQLLV